jgi:excisionase family DNA binding protein
VEENGMSASRNVIRLVERDAERLQLQLPFPDEKTIDMARCCSILHVTPHVVRRLSVTRLISGLPETCLRAYNTMRCAPLRIDYDSLVRFLSAIREKHSILDRRTPPIWGRYRDDDLLPFPWSDTIMVEEAADALSVHRSKVLLRIESGKFEAYQLAPVSPWRISRSSFAKYIESFRSAVRSERPYRS